MNIAILIGVSKYGSESPLPACSLDAESMRRLLFATRKYDDIQLINDLTSASQVKDTLRQFFAKYQGVTGVEEALIYFSGHGVYHNDALLCCSDFDSNRPATTSISNSELDDLLRSIKPNVAVKIIDACQSGSPYIKDASAGFEKALSKSQLNSFICMASSRQDQSSYASASESYFTAKWIEAATEKSDGQVLYRDIQAALADAFASDPDQTPFFVSQGTGLEVFSAVTEEMKAYRGARVKSLTTEKPDTAIAISIDEQIRELDRQFVPHAHALQAAESSKAALDAKGIQDKVVSRFYVKSVNTDSKLILIPKSREVAKFAEEQSWSKRYFCKVNQEQYKTRVLKDPLNALTSFAKRTFARYDDEDYVVETRSRPGSLEVTEPLPLEVAEISFTSTHPSLPAFVVYVGIVHSLIEVMVLSATVRLVQKGWDSRAPELSQVQWRYQIYPWTTVVQEPSILWTESQDRGETDVRAYLESLLPKTEASNEAASSAMDASDAGTAAA